MKEREEKVYHVWESRFDLYEWSERVPQVTGAPLALIVGSEIHEQQEHTPATAYQHIQNWLACWQEVLA